MVYIIYIIRNNYHVEKVSLENLHHEGFMTVQSIFYCFKTAVSYSNPYYILTGLLV